MAEKKGNRSGERAWVVGVVVVVVVVVIGGGRFSVLFGLTFGVES